MQGGSCSRITPQAASQMCATQVPAKSTGRHATEVSTPKIPAVEPTHVPAMKSTKATGMEAPHVSATETAAMKATKASTAAEVTSAPATMASSATAMCKQERRNTD